MIFRKDRRKGLPLFASILHVSDPELFHRLTGPLATPPAPAARHGRDPRRARRRRSRRPAGRSRSARPAARCSAAPRCSRPRSTTCTANWSACRGETAGPHRNETAHHAHPAPSARRRHGRPPRRRSGAHASRTRPSATPSSGTTSPPSPPGLTRSAWSAASASASTSTSASRRSSSIFGTSAAWRRLRAGQPGAEGQAGRLHPRRLRRARARHDARAPRAAARRARRRRSSSTSSCSGEAPDESPRLRDPRMGCASGHPPAPSPPPTSSTSTWRRSSTRRAAPGKPKGVVLSHRNLIAGGASVSQYLGNHEDDVILAALPLSFDAGFSQLTTAFTVGAHVVLVNYLLPRDVVRLCARARRHRADVRAAALDPAGRAGVAGRGDRRRCATSPTPAGACRRSTLEQAARDLPAAPGPS